MHRGQQPPAMAVVQARRNRSTGSAAWPALGTIAEAPPPGPFGWGRTAAAAPPPEGERPAGGSGMGGRGISGGPGGLGNPGGPGGLGGLGGPGRRGDPGGRGGLGTLGGRPGAGHADALALSALEAEGLASYLVLSRP
jgi:hypothetical protein